MIGYKQGEVVLIPFPFTDLTTFKQRPALVISSTEFNRTHRDIIVAAITSHVAGKSADDEYRLAKQEQIACGLPKPSLIKVNKIVTLDKRLIRKSLGQLPKESSEKVLLKIKKIFKTA